MTAQPVGSVAVVVDADIRKLSTSLAMGSRNVDLFARHVDQRVSLLRQGMSSLQARAILAGSAISKLAVFAGLGGVGLAAMVSKVRDAIGSVGDLADAAARAGVSAEKLQVLRQALAQNGGAAETADAALQALTVRLGQLTNQGTGTAANAVKTLGISFAQLASLSPDKKFDAIAAKLAAVEDPSRRAALAADLFGKAAGPQMAALLGQGNSVLADTEARMRSLGTLMSNETVAAGDALDDKFQELSTVIDSTFKKAVVGAAMAVYDLIDSFRALDKQTSLRNLSIELDAIAAKRDALNDTIAQIRDSNPAGAVIGPGKALVDSQIADLRKQIVDLDHQANAVLNRIGQLNADAKSQRPVLGGSASGIAPPHLTSPDADAAAVKIAQVREALQRQADALGITARQQFIMNQLTQAGTTANTAAGAAIAQAAGNLFDQEAALAKINEKMATFRDTAHDALATFIGDLRDGKTASESLTDALGRVADRLTEIAVNKALDGISGGSGGLGGGGFLSRLIGGVAGGGGLTLGSLYHTGGVVGAPGGQTRAMAASAFVGAPRFHGGLKADEIASVLLRGETVLKRGMGKRVADTMGGLASAVGGGGAVEVNVNVKGGDAQVKQRKNASGGVDIDVLIGNAIAKDVAGNGVASQMIESAFGLNRANGLGR
jgi:hypothetical protein